MTNTARNFLWGIIGLIVLIVLVVLFVRWGRGGIPNTGDNNTNTASSTMAGWSDSSDTARGIDFKYPQDLGTKYIQAFDWPPQVAVIDGPLQCTEAGTTTARTGKTTQQTINGHVYCVTRIDEGAAGSIYSQYAFARQMEDGRVAILTFTLRSPQCGNYDDPKKTECQNEESNFNIGSVIDQIFSTLKLGPPSMNYQKG